MIADEQLNIVNENDTIIGQESRDVIHQKGLLHREVGIFIYNDQGEILLQRRAPDKDIAPNKLDTSVGGHVAAGETYEMAAVKELKEETGIVVSVNDLQFLFKNIRQSNTQENGLVNYAFRSIYLYRYRKDDPLQVEAGKATSLEWWSIDRLIKLTDTEKENFTSFVYKDLPMVVPAIKKVLMMK